MFVMSKIAFLYSTLKSLFHSHACSFLYFHFNCSTLFPFLIISTISCCQHTLICHSLSDILSSFLFSPFFCFRIYIAYVEKCLFLYRFAVFSFEFLLPLLSSFFLCGLLQKLHCMSMKTQMLRSPSTDLEPFSLLCF